MAGSKIFDLSFAGALTNVVLNLFLFPGTDPSRLRSPGAQSRRRRAHELLFR